MAGQETGRRGEGAVEPGRATSAEAPRTILDMATPFGRGVLQRKLLQRRARSANAGQADTDAGIEAAAATGTSGPSTTLPFADTIQGAFGRHDVSGIQAHVGGAATAGATAMGAEAFATGNHVAFAGTPSLHTAAHEAAHVLQQKAGVQLKGGVGQEGDACERHADAVADRVVAGRSAESLLDQLPGDTGASTAVQRKLSFGSKDDMAAKKTRPVDFADLDALWSRIADDKRLADIKDQAKALLTQWIASEASYDDPRMVSENRVYANEDELVQALAGEVGSAKNLAVEKDLARRTVSEGEVNTVLGVFLERLATFHKTNVDALQEGSKKTGRYAGWGYEKASIADALLAAPGDLKGRIAVIADYALTMRGDIKKLLGSWDYRVGAELDESRMTHHNPNEGAEWVQKARTASVPLSAGPSATTAQVLALAVAVGASDKEMEALAWALFALWNDMPMHKTGTHRFHEVMAVAVGYGVPYDTFQYSDPPKA